MGQPGVVFSAAEMLSDLLGNAAPDATLIDRLVAQQASESVHLEYKSGDFLKPGALSRSGEPAKPAARLRKYVAGFANADGGTLIVGVRGADASPPWTLTGCTSPKKKEPVAEWAGQALKPLYASLYPPPRIFTVAHPSCDVLVIAVPRVNRLVPVLLEGRAVYYVRFGDGTHQAPEYLLNDLLLGRRHHPILKPRIQARLHRERLSSEFQKLQFAVTIANESPVWVEEHLVGAIGWGLRGGPSAESLLADELLAATDRLPPTIGGPDELKVVHLAQPDVRHKTPRLPPFQTATVALKFTVPAVPDLCQWRGALYVVARGSPAAWHQIQADYDGSDEAWGPMTGGSGFTGKVECNVERMDSARPVLAWESSVSR